jgi:hypothetical protein
VKEASKMPSSEDSHRDTIVGGVLHAMVGHPRRVIAIMAVVSAVLVVVGISTASDKDVSFNPSGEEFDTGDLVDRTFRPSTTELLFIVEDEGGEALDLASLREWHRNSAELRASDELSDELSSFFDDDLGITVSGTYSIADAVDDQLRTDGVPDGLEAASEDQVKQALSSLPSWRRSASITPRSRLNSRIRAIPPRALTRSKRTSTRSATSRSKNGRATRRTCSAAMNRTSTPGAWR